MSGQNFDEINQILKKLNNNKFNSHVKHTSNESKLSSNNKITKDLTVYENIKIKNNLDVSNDIFIGNKLQVNTISSKGDMEPICVNSVLQVDNISAKENNITIQDNVSMCGELKVNTILSKNENPLEIQSNTEISESLCVQNNLYTNNIYAIESNNVSENDSIVNINDNTNINADLCVQNNIIVDSIIPKSDCVNIPELSVDNIKFINNDPSYEKENITGNVRLKNDLYVNGTITSCSGIKTNNLTVGGQLTLCDTLKVPHFEVCGNTTLGNKTNLGDQPKTQVNGNLCVSKRLEVCDNTSDKVIIEKGNVCIDGNLLISRNNDVKISDGCVNAKTFVGQVAEVKLQNSTTIKNVENYTSLIVTGTDSKTDNGNLSLTNGKQGQILIVINNSDIDLLIDKINIIPGLSRTIVYHNSSWH